jgi:hypothetical protein
MIDPQAESALRYLRYGLVREAELLSETAAARPHYFGLDPVSTAAIHFVRLRASNILPSDLAARELLHFNGWLPDAAIVAAEVGAAQNDQSYVLEQLELLRTRGLPVLTGLFSIALSRLARLSADESRDTADGAKSLYRSLGNWIPFVEPGAPTVTIPANDLANPSGIPDLDREHEPEPDPKPKLKHGVKRDEVPELIGV